MPITNEEVAGDSYQVSQVTTKFSLSLIGLNKLGDVTAIHLQGDTI